MVLITVLEVNTLNSATCYIRVYCDKHISIRRVIRCFLRLPYVYISKLCNMLFVINNNMLLPKHLTLKYHWFSKDYFVNDAISPVMLRFVLRCKGLPLDCATFMANTTFMANKLAI